VPIFNAFRRVRIFSVAALGGGLLCCLLFSGCAVIAPPASVGGTWSGQLTWDESGLWSPFSMALTQDGSSLQGEVRLPGPGGQSFAIVVNDGVVGSTEFSLDASGTMILVTPSCLVQLALDGEIDGDRITGTGTQWNDGDPHTFEWSADLVAPAETEAR